MYSFRIGDAKIQNKMHAMPKEEEIGTFGGFFSKFLTSSGSPVFLCGIPTGQAEDFNRGHWFKCQ